MERPDPARPLTQRELLVIAYLLDQGADVIFKRICEDMHPDARALLTDREWDDLDWQFEQYNSGGADYEPNDGPPVQGSVASCMLSDRIKRYLGAQLGIDVAPRYDDGEVCGQIWTALLKERADHA